MVVEGAQAVIGLYERSAGVEMPIASLSTLYFTKVLRQKKYFSPY